MTIQTNPAKRLHELLTTVANVSRSHTSMYLAWSQTFNTDHPQEVMHSWLSTMDLLDSWETLIKQSPNLNEERYLGLLNTIRRALNGVGLWGSTQDLRNGISVEVLSNLSFAADATPNTENLSDEDVLKDTLSDVSGLAEEIADSDLDVNLKAVLLEAAEAMRFALLHYQLFGVDGLREAFYKNIGVRFIHNPDIQGTSVGKRIDETLDKVYTTLQYSTVRNLFKLGTATIGMLGSGTDGDMADCD